MRFFALGKLFRTRGAIAANRVGKTLGLGGYELALHLIGEYPEWWPGYQFTRAIKAWASGTTRKATREILQAKLLGEWGKFGTGLIPAANIIDYKPMPGVPEAVEIVRIQSKFGESRLVFKANEQGRDEFQGTEQDAILLDEEHDEGVRGECAVRTMSTEPGQDGGLLMETFTPKKGLTPVVLMYRGEGAEMQEDGVFIRDNRAMVQIGWGNVPHLSEDEKKRILSETAPHLKKAVSEGDPSMGAGAIYPIPEDEVTIHPFRIPVHWRRSYALDVGWNRTAAIWGVIDTDTNPDKPRLILVAEHYRAQAEPEIHAAAIKAKGDWIPGVIDPAAKGGSQIAGEKLMRIYTDLGLKLKLADNDREVGINLVWNLLSTGQLKVFSTLTNWLAEYRMYRRNEKGVIVKENDHLMDATRYWVMSGLKVATVRPARQQVIIPGYGVLDDEVGF